MDFDNTEQINTLASLPPERPKKPERSAWGAPWRFTKAATADVLGSVADVAKGYGAASAMTLEADPVARAALGDKALREGEQEGRRQIASGEALVSDVGRSFRNVSEEMRPDPATASTAEQLVFSVGRPLVKLVGAGMTMGPIGIGLASAEEGFTQSEDLRRQGVDIATRTKIGALGAGVMAASAGLPMVGPTLKATAGLYLVGGPGGFIAQQAATRAILEQADYGELAKQYDPLDPLGLAVSALIPLPFAAHGAVRNLRAGKKATASPGIAPPAAEQAPAGAEVAPAPIAAHEGVSRDAVDAALVHNLTLGQDRARSRLEGVTSQIARGVADPANGITDPVLAAAQRVREFVAGPAADRLDSSTKLNFGAVSDEAARRIESDTGFAIEPGARQEVRADAARHAQNNHPALTLDDWGALPWLAENFDRAVLLKPQRGDQGPRLALAAIDPATGRAYVAEYRTGKNKGGERLSLVTFFSDHPNAVEAYLRTNGRPRGGAEGGAEGGQGGGGTPDAPVLPSGPEALTSETGSGGWRSVTGAPEPALGRLADAVAAARLQIDALMQAGQPIGDFLSARNLPPEVSNLVIGLREAARDPRRMQALLRQLSAEAADTTKSAADATADAVEGMRALTEQQLADLDPAKPKPHTDAHLRSIAERVRAVETTAPDMPIGLDAEGRQITVAEELARIRREAAEGTDVDLGALDADLLRVAADCALSMGGAV